MKMPFDEKSDLKSKSREAMISLVQQITPENEPEASLLCGILTMKNRDQKRGR